MPNQRAILSRRIVFAASVEPAIIVVEGGKIEAIVKGTAPENIQDVRKRFPDVVFEDFGSLVVMAGLVDSHVHVNEPGRTEWEGFHTATEAAASGGITTIVDMPLNSVPPTTTLDNLRAKVEAARESIFVDVAFWGGVVPGNQKELRPLVNAGVIGFKCFLCPSGVDEFPHVNAHDVESALKELRSTNSVLAFHAECESDKKKYIPKGDPTLYETFLRSRPPAMETKAVQAVCTWCKKYKVRCHVVHLSSAESLQTVREAKSVGAPLTAETCYHYLTLAAEEIPESATSFKCCPPIRERSNQEKLWRGIQDGTIDMVVSDHSPSVAKLKSCGDFMAAWGGISSLQFGLSLMWTAAKSRGLEFPEISKLISYHPAKLCGLNNRKGAIKEGMDADFVIWDPEKTFKVQKEDIRYKNKFSPYEGKILHGAVIATMLRGRYIYKNNEVYEKPTGNVLLNAEFC